MKNIRFSKSEIRALHIIESSRTSPRLGVRLLAGEMHGIRHRTLKKALDAGLVQQQEGCWFQLSDEGRRRLRIYVAGTGAGRRTEKKTMPAQYPEHDKLRAIRDKSQAVGEFLEWLQSERRSSLYHRAKAHDPLAALNIRGSLPVCTPGPGWTLAKEAAMKIEIEVPEKVIAYALCSAFEGGIRYWASKCETNRGFVQTPVAKPWGDDYTPTYVSYPLTEGASVTIEVAEDSAKAARPLTLEALRSGLRIMAEQYPQHFADVLNGGDATTGDVLVQLAVFGEIVFG